MPQSHQLVRHGRRLPVPTFEPRASWTGWHPRASTIVGVESVVTRFRSPIAVRPAGAELTVDGQPDERVFLNTDVHGVRGRCPRGQKPRPTGGIIDGCLDGDRRD
jgi:hypothetical protein